MRSLVILVASLAAVLAAPQQRPQEIAIVRLENDVGPDGSFVYAYETANGIRAEARGQPRGDSQSVQGSYSFTADDGQTYSIQYNADENGYQPQGAHLPTPPPTPEAILKSLEFNLQNPEPQEGINLRSG